MMLCGVMRVVMTLQLLCGKKMNGISTDRFGGFDSALTVSLDQLHSVLSGLQRSVLNLLVIDSLKAYSPPVSRTGSPQVFSRVQILPK